jgi:hypothetical protein
MMRSPRSGIETFPKSWSISPWPVWTQDVTALCNKYVEEIDEASESIKECRKMESVWAARLRDRTNNWQVLDQRSLLQSRNGAILTILASIFVPANFVTVIVIKTRI